MSRYQGNVMTTSVSANWKLPSKHHIFFNELFICFKEQYYIAFFYEISCLIAITLRIQINAAYFLYFRHLYNNNNDNNNNNNSKSIPGQQFGCDSPLPVQPLCQ